jgi:hypothetical protein
LTGIIIYFRSKGSSLSFITREDWKQAQNLIDILEEANQVKLEIFMQMPFACDDINCMV